MNTTEHLERIKARCEQLLVIAERRTHGEWINGGRYDLDYVHNRDDAFCTMSTHNAAFIASCAGPAEAGWRATIAAIDDILPYLQEDDATDGSSEPGHKWLLNKRAEPITAAWPEELL